MMVLRTIFLTIFLMTVTVCARMEESDILYCRNNMFCYKTIQSSWYRYKEQAETLKHLTSVADSADNPFVNVTGNIRSLILAREDLCSDETFTGFLLEENTKNGTNSCLWSGSEIVTRCAPVPQKYRENPYYYIHPTIWQKKLKTFRSQIGCSKEQVNQALSVGELHVCNERCIQGGIGYLASLIMLISFSIACIRGCQQ